MSKVCEGEDSTKIVNRSYGRCKGGAGAAQIANHHDGESDYDPSERDASSTDFAGATSKDGKKLKDAPNDGHLSLLRSSSDATSLDASSKDSRCFQSDANTMDKNNVEGTAERHTYTGKPRASQDLDVEFEDEDDDTDIFDSDYTDDESEEEECDDDGVVKKKEDDTLRKSTKAQKRSKGKWSKLTAWYNIGLLGTIVSILGFLSALLYEFRPSKSSDPSSWRNTARWDLIGLFIIFISVPTTHWFVGRKRHRNAFGAFQPFVGGAKFVVLQAIGWAVYAFFTIGFLWVAYKGALGFTKYVVSSLGLTGILVQLLTIASIHYFSKKSQDADSGESVSGAEALSRRRKLSSGTKSGRLRSSSSPPPLAESSQDKTPAPQRSALAGKVGTALTLLSLIAAVILESVELSPDPNSPSRHGATVAGVVGLSSVLVAVPLTHGMGGLSLYPSHYKLYQPLKGGVKFVLLQAVGWALWTITLIIAIAVGSAGLRHAQNFKGLLTVGGCFAVVSQVLVLNSLKYFDARVRIARNEKKIWARIQSEMPGSELAEQPTLREGSGDKLFPQKAEALTAEVETKEASAFREEAQDLIIPRPLLEETLHEKEVDLRQRKSLLVPPIPSIPPITPMASSELRDEISREAVADAAAKHAKVQPPLRFHEIVEGVALLCDRQRIYDRILDLFDLCVVGTLFHFPVLASIFVLGPIGLAFYFGPLSIQFMSVLLCQALYYSTYLSDHHITGKLASPNARKPIWLWRAFRRYFHGRIISKASYLDPAKQYQFCFHPHGIYPMTCFWATRSEEFQALHPDIEIDVLGASVIMFAPAMRELFLWSGGRDVSRRALLQCYSEGRNVMLVPGGQKEMRWVNGTEPNRFVLYTKHQGFVRLALQNGVALVPVISFGENDILHNVSWPSVQAWTYRKIGVALPMYPHGRWFTPIPNRVKVTVVFGEPIHMPTIAQPTKEEVDMYHRQYYEAVRQLFESTKADAGFPNGTLEYN